MLREDPYGYLKSPKNLLTKSWENNHEKGSSTFVVVTLPPDEAKIYSSYVGDSGYCILRPDAKGDEKFLLHFESKPQQRRFNYPYQLGWERNGDHPEVALTFSHEVKDGDLVILGTDGLFDNMTPKEVGTTHQLCKLVSQYVNENDFESQGLAEKIAKRAYLHSLDKNYNSPFAQEAARAGRLYQGGKSDDITVVVAKINIHQSSPAGEGQGQTN